MANRIERDSGRYREIVKGQVRKELKKFISHSELLGKKGTNLVSIPIPRVDIPQFRFDPGGMGTWARAKATWAMSSGGASRAPAAARAQAISQGRTSWRSS